MAIEKTNSHSDYTIKVVLSESLAEETRKVVRLLRNEPKNSETGKKAIHLLRQAAEVNLSFYFTEPAKQLNIGSIGIKLLNMGANTILKLISSVGHKIVHRLSEEQFSQIADFVEMHLLADDLTR